MTLSAALLAAGCGGDREALPYVASWPTMGTLASLQIHELQSAWAAVE